MADHRATREGTGWRLTSRGERALIFLCGIGGALLLVIAVYAYIHLGAKLGHG